MVEIFDGSFDNYIKLYTTTINYNNKAGTKSCNFYNHYKKLCDKSDIKYLYDNQSIFTKQFKKFEKYRSHSNTIIKNLYIKPIKRSILLIQNKPEPKIYTLLQQQQISARQNGLEFENKLHNKLNDFFKWDICLKGDFNIRKYFNRTDLNGIDHFLKYNDYIILIQDKIHQVKVHQEKIDHFIMATQKIIDTFGLDFNYFCLVPIKCMYQVMVYQNHHKKILLISIKNTIVKDIIILITHQKKN
jgi:hypothetical protein